MVLYGHAPFAPNGTGPAENKAIEARARKCDLSSLDRDQEVSSEVKDLMRKTIVVDPTKRLDAKAAKGHAWFKRYTAELEALYKKACIGWKEREVPVEWVDVVEGGQKIVPNKRKSDYFSGKHKLPRKPSLEIITELDESAIEENMGNFRIDSPFEYVEDSYGNGDGNGDIDMTDAL